jgi:hypothetical protein
MRDDVPVTVVSAEEVAARPVDVVTIRRTCEAGLHCVRDDDLDLLRGQLIGHVRELVLAVDRLLLHAQGERRLLTELSLKRARAVLDEVPGPAMHVQAAHVYDLATVCRPLLSLYESPGTSERP